MNNYHRIIIKTVRWFLYISVIGGFYFWLVVPSYYSFKYISEKENPIRHEYIEGVVLSFLIGIWFWVAAAILLSLIRFTVFKTKR